MTDTDDPLTLRHTAAIEGNPQIARIEQPGYKRRWNDTPWEEKVTAMYEWISCAKDPYYGGCTGSGFPGGLRAIEKYLGPVQIVTGLHLYQEANVEHDASVHAVRHYLPGRILGFGYTDHGPLIADEKNRQLIKDLLTIMVPSIETSAISSSVV